jgi:hypothetical protein
MGELQRVGMRQVMRRITRLKQYTFDENDFEHLFVDWKTGCKECRELFVKAIKSKKIKVSKELMHTPMRPELKQKLAELICLSTI